MTTALKAPTTPISQQLERLLNPAGANVAPPAVPSSGSPPTTRAASMLQSSSSSGLLPAAADPSDPSAALDNLFAAKFSFQFDNLQHILRYMLGELRSAKRDKSEVERVSQRLKDLEANGDSMTTLTQQAAVCRKHNTHVSGALGRIEDRMTKEGALASRRLGALEVRGDKVESQLAQHATQIESITQHVQSQAAQLAQLAKEKPTGSSDHGASSSSSSSASAAFQNLVPLSSLPSAGLISASSSKRDALEFEGMTSQISKFMLSHSTALALLQEKVAAMEDAEASAKRVAADWETKWNYIQNENRRLQTKVGNMEEALDLMKMNPTVLAQPTAANAAAATPAVPSMTPSTHAPTGSLPLPADGSNATGTADVDIAVELDPSRGLPALDAGTTVRGTGLSEADLSALQARLESTFSGRVEDLKSQIEERWSTERELARDHRVQILASTQAAAESALEARSALQETKKAQEDALAAVAAATERASASVAGAALLQGMSPSDDGSSAENEAEATPAFAGAEILRGSSPPSLKARPLKGFGSAAGAAAAPAGPVAQSGAAGSGGRVVAPKILNISQHDFDRVRAMAELALRRTVQHSEILALAQGSAAGFEKGSLGASGSGGAGGSTSSLGGASALDMEKLRASQSNVSGRILHVEDKLDTLNALSLATRKQVSQLASDFANNPLVKSMSLRIFEQDVKFAEVADKVQLLAHLLAKGNLLSSPPSQTTLGRSASQAKKMQQPQQQQPLTTAQLPNRSLVSALSADEKAAAQRDDLSDNEDDMDSRAQMAAGSTRRPAVPSSSATGDAGSYTDDVDPDAVALGMVLRGSASSAAVSATGAAAASGSAAAMTKDLRVLGSLQEKLASAAALDAKLASIEVLEGKVEALLDMDIKERMSFLERRFTTELTFLRSHVNSKVDSSSLKILLEKIELENAHSAATLEATRATLAAAQEDVRHSKHAAHVSPTRGRAHSREQKASVDLTADGSHIEIGGRGGGGHSIGGASGAGSMARSTARDTRSKVSAELESKNRDRKARMAHLLAMLEKKADVGSIKQLEEFVRSIDRHLRGLMHAHSVQLRQLEARGLIEPMDHLKSTKSKSIGGGGGGVGATLLSGGGGSGGGGGGGGGMPRTTVPGYDEPHQSGPSRSLKKRAAAAHGEYEDEDHEDDEHGAHDAVRPPRTMSLLNSPKHSLSSQGSPSETEESARVGFHVSNSTNEVVALQEQCEDLQRQIAALHGLLSRKADRTLDGSAQPSSGPVVIGGGLGAVADGSLIHVGTVPATLDGLVLNPALSLVDHPHISRLSSRLARVEKDQTALQGMVMYQSKQLRNHREWIAKHSREIGALKEWIQHTQGMQANNVAALSASAAGTAAQQPSGSQSAREPSAPSSSTVAALAAQSSYPSPAVFQLLRQAEQDILSLRRSLRNKIDFMDLGISHPHDASQSLSLAAAGNYPHPTLEDLRRLLFYLTPQLQAGTIGGGGGSGGGSITGYASSSGGAESKVSMFTSKMPAIDSHAHAHGHTHGPGAPETWKCIACDRAMESINTRASGSGGARGGGASAPGVSRHAAMTSSLSSIAPAGGLVGANTRRLIAATNPNTLFASGGVTGAGGHSPRIQTAPSLPQQQSQQQQQQPPASAGAASLTPRPPPAAPAAAGKRAATSKTASDPATAAPVAAPTADAAAAAAVAAAEKAARKAEKKRVRAEEKAAAARITLAAARGVSPASAAAPKPALQSMHSLVEVAEAAVGARRGGELVVTSTTEHAAAKDEKSEATP